MAVQNSISLLSRKVDSLKTIADSLNESQLLLSSKIDTLFEMNSDMVLSRSELSQSFDTISTQLKTISEYGTGFSDSVSHIAIPLIIALFAFAFPFLFTVISHINNKYESEHITKLFSSEPSYKWFLKGAWISAIYLSIAGVLSICISGGGYKWLMRIIDWTSIVVAGGYSVIILWFVRKCIGYNNPQILIDSIDEKFWRGVKESKAYLKKLNKEEKKNAKEKSKGKRRFKDQRISIGKAYAFYGVEDSRTKCLVELCKYAFRKQDYDLFLSVLLKVDNLPHPEKHYENQRFLFFEQVVDAYLYCEQNIKIEESLMRHWFYAFNRAEKTNEGVIYRMLGKIVSAVMQGRTSIFVQYIQCASSGYTFINHLPIVSYVRGKSVEDQKRADNDRLDCWLELCEMHYIALAHLFSAGKVEPLKAVFSGKNIGYGRLFPASGTEMLKLYARCKEHQEKDGTFAHYWFLRDAVGENTDPEMLEKLTSLLLLLASEVSNQSLNLISKSRLELIKRSENKIIGYAKVWLGSSELLNLFPQLVDMDVKKRFYVFVNQLEEAEHIENKMDNKTLLIKVVYGFMKFLCEGCVVELGEDIYQKKLPDAVKDEVKTMFRNILYGNAVGVFDNLVGENNDSKVDSMMMGEINFMTYKYALMEQEDIYNHQVFKNLLNVFKSRYLFMIYSALAHMHIKDVFISIDEFEEFFEENVGKDASEYFIIDSDSHYNMEELVEGGRFSLGCTYKGASYKSCDLSFGWYLRDIPELESFKETLIIIKRKDLPAVLSISGTEGPSVDFTEESDREKGIAAISMVVNPNYEMRFSKEAEVFRLRLKILK